MMGKKNNIGVGDVVEVVKCELGGHQVGTMGVVVDMTSYDYEVRNEHGDSKFHAGYELKKMRGATA